MNKPKRLLSAAAAVAWAPLLLALSLSGCMHIEERVVINSDGTGLVKAHLKVHAGTVQLVDAMFGGMMQAFASLGAKPGQDAPPPLGSAAEKMFADKAEILNKIKKSGFEASLESFESQKKDGALLVDYTVKVADVAALSRSNLLMTRVRIMRNEQGDWFCRPLADRKKKKEGQSQQVQFDKFKDSPEFKAMPADMQRQMQESIMDFKASFSLEFPVPVTEITGMFEKEDARTVVFGFSLDMLQDPQKFQNLASAAAVQLARTGSGPVPAGFLTPAPEEEESADKEVTAGEGEDGAPGIGAGPGLAEKTASVQVQQKVMVRLKAGTTVEGRLLEKTGNFIKIDFEGVVLTYYNDEVDSVE